MVLIEQITRIKAIANDSNKEFYLICSNCNKAIVDDVMQSNSGHYFCSDCYSETFNSCEDCHNEIDRDEAIYCRGCDYAYCNDCSYLCRHCDDYFCSDCYNENHGDNCECYERDNDNNTSREIQIQFKKITSKSFKKNKFKNFCGVEIETNNNNLRENSFSESELNKYQFSQVYDGSLSNGMEFPSNAFNGDLLNKNISAFCKELNNRDYFINRSCGLHIHIEINKRAEYLKKVLLFYRKYEEFLFNMLPQSRQNNSMCQKMRALTLFDEDKIKALKTTTDLKKLYYETTSYNRIKSHCKNKWYGKRYLWLNLHSLFYRGTLEIRNHAGTTNADKINNWLNIHLTILDFLKNINIETLDLLPITENVFLSLFNKDIQSYIKSRWELFQDESQEENN